MSIKKVVHPQSTYTTIKTPRIAELFINQDGERMIRMSFKFSSDLVDLIKTLPGRIYIKEDQCWYAPVYEDSLINLLKWDFSLDEKLKIFLKNASSRRERIRTNTKIYKGELYPFQKEGVAFIENHGGRILLADEMGLGKTIQTLAWLQLHSELRPVIIVCPASLKLNWQRETIKWTTGATVEILEGIVPYKPRGSIIIINYDIVQYWIGFLTGMNAKVLITDECHYYKSTTARRTKAIQTIERGIPHFIALSGTPVVNRPIEAFNALHLVSPQLFPNYWKYAQRYCGLTTGRFGLNKNGATNTLELHNKLIASIMLRRLKKDVLKDLPEKVYSYVPMELDDLAYYKEAENNFIAFLIQTRGIEVAQRANNAKALTQIEVLRQVAVAQKMTNAISWIKDFLEIEDKLVVFVTHRHSIELLMKEFGKIAVKMDGSMTHKAQQDSADIFQEDPKIKLFIGMLDSMGRPAGEGWNLTASSNVAFLELPWGPTRLDQAADRCHRIGQKDSVTVYYLLAANTIEERMARIIDEKRTVIEAIIDGKVTEDESLLISLINSYLNDNTR